MSNKLSSRFFIVALATCISTATGQSLNNPISPGKRANSSHLLLDPVPVPGVPSIFCFRITHIDADKSDPENDRFHFLFEALNWADKPAAGVYIAIAEGSAFPGAPFFTAATIDANGRPIGPVSDPPPGNDNPPNNWAASSVTNTAIMWKAGATGTPIPFIDLITAGQIDRCNACALVPGCECVINPGDETTTPTIANLETIDDTLNVLDGFQFTVDDFDIGDILTFNWFLVAPDGNAIGTAGFGNEFGFGTVNIARVDNGVIPDPVFVGNTGFSQSQALFYSDVYIVPDPAIFAAEFGGGITARFVNPADNIFNAAINTSLIKPICVDKTPPACKFSFRGISTVKGAFVDDESGIASVQPLLLYNCKLIVDPFTPGDKQVNFRLEGLGQDSYLGFDIKITDVCGNTHVCDPVMTILSAERGMRNYTFKFRPVDRYLILANRGLTSIRVNLNGERFDLYAEPPGGVQTLNAYRMPKEGEISIDLQPYLRDGENIMQVEIDGPASASADFLLIDEAHVVNHTLALQPIPAEFQLQQNYPNPFNPSTTIRFGIPAHLTSGAAVQLRIYNMKGELVRTLVDETMYPGQYAIEWNGRNKLDKTAASGIYMYQLITSAFKTTKRMIFLK